MLSIRVRNVVPCCRSDSPTREASSSGDRQLRLSGSVGIALAPDHGTTGESLVRLADAAMYEAKAAGAGQVRFAAV